MLGLVDRYLIREMVFPFVLAVAGFVLFIVLNLIPQLSDFMLDRNVPLLTLFQMLAYRLPELLVYGLPVGVLFAIFWALGRLSHDRELVALQAAGFSLRRLMLPVVLMGVITTGAAFAVGELWMPWANHRYYDLLREIFFIRSSPQIRESTFIKISDTAYAYIERYDPTTKKLSNVMVFDQGGGEYLAELDARFPKIIVAPEGEWDGEYWRLTQGKLHKLRDDGQLEYTLTFEKLSIRTGPYLQRIFLEQRTPHEMGIAELYQQIQGLRRSRLGAESLIVELHSKIAVPFSALVFALFGAPLSLIFAQGGAPRGRAAGVILSVVLVACYQGLLLWMSTLGKRGVIAPALAPWVPNILFLVLGVLLLIWVDRLSRLDLFARLRQLFALVLLCGALSGFAGLAQEPPPLAFDLQADRLTVARDWSEIAAEGHVRFTYEKGRLQADRLSAQRITLADLSSRPTPPAPDLSPAPSPKEGGEPLPLREGVGVRSGRGEAWRITAEGRVVWEGEGLKGESEKIELQIAWDGTAWQLESARLHEASLEYRQGRARASEIVVQGERTATFTNFLGQTQFESAARKQETLRFQGATAHVTFSPDGEIKLLQITTGEITTCTCPEPITRAAYSIAAGSVRVEPNESVFATNIFLKAYGLPVFWAPVYFASLKEETKTPLLPDFGQLPDRGWYLRWRVPFVIDQDNTGTLLIDYYTRLPEVGTGIEYRYQLFGQQGQVSVYRLVGRGESWAVDWTHQARLPLGMRLSVGIASRTGLLEREAQRLFSRALLSASWGVVRWSLLWSRDHYLVLPEPESEEAARYRFLEKTPELTLALTPWRLGPLPLSVLASTSWGRYREKKLDKEILDESTRWETVLGVQSLALGTDSFTVQASANYRLALYEPQRLRREAYDLTVALGVRPVSGLSADTTYAYRRVLGQSPFSFDALDLLHRVSFRASWATAPLAPNLSGGYDLTLHRFDPLRLALRSPLLGLDLSWDLEYDLNRALWQRAALTVNGSWDTLTAQLTTAFLFPTRTFEDVILKISWGAQRLGASINLNRFALIRLNLETSWQWGSDWEFSLKGEYDLPTQRVTALQLGVIKKFCHACWQVGLYSDSRRIWLQAQINAFPTAQVRYSPTDQRLSFGS
jgi:LPS export ABC transporter permease LptF